MKPSTRIKRLRVIADTLEAMEWRQTELYAERVCLWREGRAEGQSTAELADASRVRPVTVRVLMSKE